MTELELRDHFAGVALNGALSACQGFNANQSQVSRIACSAYLYADAMLKARTAKPQQLKNWELPS